jgi:hypothetical protein
MLYWTGAQMTSIHRMCVISRRCRTCGTTSLRRCCCTSVVVLWHHGVVALWSCDALLMWCWSSSTVRLHDPEVGYGCLHQQRSCGNVPAHSVFKGIHTVAVLLLFNYIDRSWAKGWRKFFVFCIGPNTYKRNTMTKSKLPS